MSGPSASVSDGEQRVVGAEAAVGGEVDPARRRRARPRRPRRARRRRRGTRAPGSGRRSAATSAAACGRPGPATSTGAAVARRAPARRLRAPPQPRRRRDGQRPGRAGGQRRPGQRVERARWARARARASPIAVAQRGEQGGVEPARRRPRARRAAASPPTPRASRRSAKRSASASRPRRGDGAERVQPRAAAGERHGVQPVLVRDELHQRAVAERAAAARRGGAAVGRGAAGAGAGGVPRPAAHGVLRAPPRARAAPAVGRPASTASSIGGHDAAQLVQVRGEALVARRAGGPQQQAARAPALRGGRARAPASARSSARRTPSSATSSPSPEACARSSDEPSVARCASAARRPASTRPGGRAGVAPRGPGQRLGVPGARAQLGRPARPRRGGGAPAPRPRPPAVRARARAGPRSAARRARRPPSRRPRAPRPSGARRPGWPARRAGSPAARRSGRAPPTPAGAGARTRAAPAGRAAAACAASPASRCASASRSRASARSGPMPAAASSATARSAARRASATSRARQQHLAAVHEQQRDRHAEPAVVLLGPVVRGERGRHVAAARGDPAEVVPVLRRAQVLPERSVERLGPAQVGLGGARARRGRRCSTARLASSRASHSTSPWRRSAPGGGAVALERLVEPAELLQDHRALHRRARRVDPVEHGQRRVDRVQRLAGGAAQREREGEAHAGLRRSQREPAGLGDRHRPPQVARRARRGRPARSPRGRAPARPWTPRRRPRAGAPGPARAARRGGRRGDRPARAGSPPPPRAARRRSEHVHGVATRRAPAAESTRTRRRAGPGASAPAKKRPWASAARSSAPGGALERHGGGLRRQQLARQLPALGRGADLELHGQVAGGEAQQDVGLPLRTGASSSSAPRCPRRARRARRPACASPAPRGPRRGRRPAPGRVRAPRARAPPAVARRPDAARRDRSSRSSHVPPDPHESAPAAVIPTVPASVRSLARQRMRVGPMLPIGIPRIAPISS